MAPRVQKPSSDIAVEPSRRLTLEWAVFLGRMAQAINEIFAPTVYAVAALPNAAAMTGRLIYVGDEAGGAVIAFSDGVDWRRVTDRAVVS